MSAGVPGGQLAAQVQHGHMIADVEDQVGMVLDQQHAGAALADLLDQLAQPPDLVGRQAGRRLVQQQERRMQHQRAGDLHEAQLAVLQPVGPHGGQRLQPDGAQRQHRLLAQRAFVAPVPGQAQQRLGEGRGAVDRAADHHVLQHRRLADQPRRLEGAGNAQAGAGLRRAVRQVVRRRARCGRPPGCSSR